MHNFSWFSSQQRKKGTRKRKVKEFKSCRLCKTIKPRSEFHIRKTGYAYSECKPCASKYTTEKVKKLRLDLIESLGGSCRNCGSSDRPMILVDLDKQLGDRHGGTLYWKIKKDPDDCRYWVFCIKCYKR